MVHLQYGQRNRRNLHSLCFTYPRTVAVRRISQKEAVVHCRGDASRAGPLNATSLTSDPDSWNNPASPSSSGLAPWACLFRCSSNALRFARSSAITCSHLLRVWASMRTSACASSARLCALTSFVWRSRNVRSSRRRVIRS